MPPKAATRRKAADAPAPAARLTTRRDANGLAERLEGVTIAAPASARTRVPTTAAKAAPARPAASTSASTLPPAQRSANAMAAVNTSLKLLGTPATAATSKAQLEQAATRAMAALEALRGLREAVPALKTKPLDAEKAAGALVSALLAQGMTSEALKAARASRDGLIALYATPSPASTDAGLISFPAPAEASQAAMAPLVLSLQLHLITILAKLPTRPTAADLLAAVVAPTGPLAWHALYPSAGRSDSQLTSFGNALLKLAIADETAPPATRFVLRSYALQCLAASPALYASEGAEARIEAVWEQARRAADSLVRAARSEATASVRELFVALVDLVRRHRDSPASGPRFAAFVDVVMQLARRAGDLETVRLAASYVAASAEPSSTSRAIDAASVAAKLTTASVAVERWRKLGEDGTVAQALAEAVAVLTALGKSESSSAVTGDGRVGKAFEKLRYACSRCVKDGKPGFDVLGALDVLAAHVERSGPSDASLANGAVDSLVLLANRRFEVASRDTHSIAFALLERAATMLHDDPLRHRCVSGAFFNMGASLRREASAIRFLRRACELGRIHCVDLLPARYEALALVHYAVGDRSEARAAYEQAALARSDEWFAALGLRAAKESVATLAAEDELATFVKHVARATRIAALDLLDLDKVAIELPASVRGLGYELQAAALAASAHSSAAAKAMAMLLERALGEYAADEHPIRRARVLIRQLELGCGGGEDEVTELLSRSKLGTDVGLKRHIAQLAILAALARSLARYRLRTADSSTRAIENARDALPGIRQLLSVASSAAAASPRQRASPAAKPLRPRRSGPQASSVPPQTPARKTSSALTELKTPPNRHLPKSTSLLSLPSPARAAVETTRLDGRIDNPEHLLEQLDAVASMLGLLGQSFLRIGYLHACRRLVESSSVFERADRYVRYSTSLAGEMLVLGQWTRAGVVLGQAEAKIAHARDSPSPVSSAVEARLMLRRSEYFALIGSRQASANAFRDALAVHDAQEPPSTAARGPQQIVQRTHELVDAAAAASAFSVVQQAHGELSPALNAASQAHRLLGRALANVARLAPAATDAPPSTEPDAFAADAPAGSQSTAVVVSGNAPARRLPALPALGLACSIGEQLLLAISRLALLHVSRGSPKPALHHLEQVITLADDLASPVFASRARTLRAELYMLRGTDDLVAAELEAALLHIPSSSEPESVYIERMRADLHLKRQLLAEAHDGYRATSSALELLDRLFHDEHVHSSPPRRISAVSPRQPLTVDALLPSVFAHILRQRAWLLALEDKPDESVALLKRLGKLTADDESKAEEHALLARIKLRDLMRRCTKDPVLGLLRDSALSTPTISTTAIKSTSSRLRSDVIGAFAELETTLRSALALSSSTAMSHRIRALCLSLASLRTMQAALANGGRSAALITAAHLDASVAITLRRDMLLALDAKLADRSTRDDLVWPRPSDEVDLPLDALSLADAPSMRSFWAETRRRYAAPTSDGLWPTIRPELPAGWDIVSLHVAEDQDSLFIVRYRADRDHPLVVRLPFDRLGRRDGDDEIFGLRPALDELEDIVARANATCQSAKHVTTSEQRAEWWTERKDLDRRLGELLALVEQRWFGAFRVLLGHSTPPYALDRLTRLRHTVEDVLKRAYAHGQRNGGVARIRLDEAGLEALAGMVPSCEDDDLEDWLHYVTEAHQFAGLHIAADEIDVDQVVVDLRTALEELHSVETADDVDRHLILILDKSIQSFPWESMPILRGRSVSRVPSLSFLLDRLRLRPHFGAVDPQRAFFVLNPAGDLKHTQSTFEPYLRTQEKRQGWRGVIGRPPLEVEMRDGLSSSDVFLFFGHGGAEQYLRSAAIRQLDRCAVALLWGCSSGTLRDLGDFEADGTPNNYMVAGSPCIVANLFDVTDKDCDRLTKATLSKWGLGEDQPGLSLTRALAESRDVTILRYLNGAAPVAFGIPITLRA